MKKIHLKYLILLFGFFASMLMSCSKSISDFGNINQNPNATTVPITSALLTRVLSNLSGHVWGNLTNTSGGLYCQYMSETQYTDVSRYANPNANWDGFYNGDLYDLQNIINTNTDASTKVQAAQFGSNNNQIAIARIIKAYTFMIITDTWGDVPYSEALKGEGSIPYDKQENIYPDLIKELKAASAQFDGGLTVQGDIVYAGNTVKWKKFAQSLIAMIALRMSKANPTLGKAEFAAAISAGVIDANADNAAITPPGGNFVNPIYGAYAITKRFDFAVSKTLTDYMSGISDPRLAMYASNATGFPYGYTRNDALAWQTANPNFAWLYSYNTTPEKMPMYVITAGQIFLARAQAARLGWTTETPAVMYENGVRAEMARWGVTSTSAIATYLTSTGVALDGSANDDKKIAEQRWLSHFPDGNQGWAEWRRTGFPILTPAPSSGSQIPRRIPYGPNEPLLNAKNYANAAALYNSNSKDAKVWWDK